MLLLAASQQQALGVLSCLERVPVHNEKKEAKHVLTFSALQTSLDAELCSDLQLRPVHKLLFVSFLFSFFGIVSAHRIVDLR